jgi:septum site-determining protein MinD
MGKIIGIVSGKGGVGKTTTTTNLGVALQKLGKKVCVFDANITTSNLGLHLGITDYPVTSHELLRSKKLTDSIFVHHSGLRIIPGSLSLENAKSLNISNLKQVLASIARKYDFILVDGAPGIDREALSVVEASDEVIVVTNPEMPAITDAIKIIEVAKGIDAKILGLIINKRRNKDYELAAREIESATGVPILGTVPEDENVLRAISEKNPVVIAKEGAPSARSFKRIAADIAGIPIEDTDFISMLKRIFFGVPAKPEIEKLTED